MAWATTCCRCGHPFGYQLSRLHVFWSCLEPVIRKGVTKHYPFLWELHHFATSSFPQPQPTAATRLNNRDMLVSKKELRNMVFSPSEKELHTMVFSPGVLLIMTDGHIMKLDVVPVMATYLGNRTVTALSSTSKSMHSCLEDTLGSRFLGSLSCTVWDEKDILPDDQDQPSYMFSLGSY